MLGYDEGKLDLNPSTDPGDKCAMRHEPVLPDDIDSYRFDLGPKIRRRDQQDFSQCLAYGGDRTGQDGDADEN